VVEKLEGLKKDEGREETLKKQEQDDRPEGLGDRPTGPGGRLQLPPSEKSAGNSRVNESDISAAQPLDFGAGQGSLPRWAQSIVGAADTSQALIRPGAQPEGQGGDADASMEQLFEHNLERVGEATEEVKGVPTGTGKYQIDLLDGNDDEDELGDLALLNQEEMDEDEKAVKQSLEQNKFESLFGMEGDEGAVSTNLRKSRDWFSKKSNSRIRSSIASKFFHQREEISARKDSVA